MAKRKMKKARPFEKLMQILLPGNPVSKDEIAELLGWTEPRGSKVKGPKIYNISSYIWDIKNLPEVDGRSIVVRSIRDGKKVTAYQIVNTDDARKYLENRGLILTSKEMTQAPVLPKITPPVKELASVQINGTPEKQPKKKKSNKSAKKEAA